MRHAQDRGSHAARTGARREPCRASTARPRPPLRRRRGCAGSRSVPPCGGRAPRTRPGAIARSRTARPPRATASDRGGLPPPPHPGRRPGGSGRLVPRSRRRLEGTTWPARVPRGASLPVVSPARRRSGRPAGARRPLPRAAATCGRRRRAPRAGARGARAPAAGRDARRRSRSRRVPRPRDGSGPVWLTSRRERVSLPPFHTNPEIRSGPCEAGERGSSPRCRCRHPCPPFPQERRGT